jgi:hypothetical protein
MIGTSMNPHNLVGHQDYWIPCELDLNLAELLMSAIKAGKYRLVRQHGGYHDLGCIT